MCVLIYLVLVWIKVVCVLIYLALVWVKVVCVLIYLDGFGLRVCVF